MYPCLVDVFTQDECLNIINKLDGIKEYWTYRCSNGPSSTYTLGAATYQDCHDLDNYYKSSIATNKIILNTFSQEYERILEVLNKEVGPSELEYDLSVPGFNIFVNDSEKQFSLLSLGDVITHTDFVDDTHDKIFQKKYKNINHDEKISFTLSLELPRGGSGISVWGDSSLDKYDHDQEFSKIIKKIGYYNNNKPSIVNYYVGKAFIFSGRYPHQVTPTVKYYLGDRRITIQGHAINCDGKFRWFV